MEEKTKKVIKDIFSRFGKGWSLYEGSFHHYLKAVYFLCKNGNTKYLGIYGPKDAKDGLFKVKLYRELDDGNGKAIKLYGLNSKIKGHLKKVFPGLLPSPLGVVPSFGFGDRLGVATPGHIRSLGEGRKITPVFSQQSIRETEKTSRTLEDVIDDAFMGVFQEGYEGAWAADADHVKEKKDIIAAVDAGFTMFTIDTTDLLGGSDDKDPALSGTFSNLRKDPKNIMYRYSQKSFRLGGPEDAVVISYSEDEVNEILKVYGMAIDFVSCIYKLICSRSKRFDFEVSFDETNTVTTPKAHYLIATLMKDEGIDFSSLALRFPGIFEKGIEYKGEVEEFEKSAMLHGMIARSLGEYRLSLHSGSDKLSVYPAFSEATGGLFHIKTSGTSWLEALRVVAVTDKELFYSIYSLAASTFEENNRSYHLNLDPKSIPSTIKGDPSIGQGSVVYEEKTRQVLHISYGPVLNNFKKDIYKILAENEEKHNDFLNQHLGKHLDALSNGRSI